ncbi:MAG: DNA alkylation repair protein [Candidatus Nomurabacteria bacterium]|jgi:3-methyladenine DNA glycosylase AlkD|nr:DNA alkylation repair protein [Candidatus Nomurabacteria bacterium]
MSEKSQPKKSPIKSDNPFDKSSKSASDQPAKFDEPIIRAALENLAKGNAAYAKFNARIVQTRQTVLGVRTPALRTFAKKLARQISGYDDAAELLRIIDDKIFEEVLLVGFALNYAKNLTTGERIALTKIYLEKVDSWAQIDTFIGKYPAAALDEYWNFALECLGSSREMAVRCGLIILFENFLTSEKIDEVLAKVRAVKSDKYYVRMAAAWLYAEAAVNFYELILTELLRPEIDVWTKTKALSKMLESRRFSPAQKAEIRATRDELKSGAAKNSGIAAKKFGANLKKSAVKNHTDGTKISGNGVKNSADCGENNSAKTAERD